MHQSQVHWRRFGAPAPALLLLALCLLAVGAQALSDSPALVVNEPGRYTLDHDIATDAAVGVLVNGSNVVFDGMGHTIAGTGQNGSVGVLVSGRTAIAEGELGTNVTVLNVTVSGWDDGIRIAETQNTVVERVVAEQNAVGLVINASTGITDNHLVRDSVFRENTGTLLRGKGIFIGYPAQGITVERCTITGNSGGIYADEVHSGSVPNTLIDSVISDNAGDGVASHTGSFSLVRNCTVSGNGDDGLEFEHGGARIEDNRIRENVAAGVHASDRGGSNITANRIEGNGQGVLAGGDWPSTVWNNYLNNTDNGYFGPVEAGLLNVTKSAGPNIVGGPYFGGNFWAHPNGTGFSQTHPDTDGDGFCDVPYTVNPEEGVTDYLPLALPNQTPGPIGGDTGYFLVSAVPAGAEIYLEDISGTRTLQGTTSAGPLNVTIYLTATPIRAIIATLPGYREAVYAVTQYPPKGATFYVSLTLVPAAEAPDRPNVVPGRIQAEDYDLGGEGVAYHDTTPGNTGGAYRHDDVDIESAGGVTNVGWIRDGEQLKYTVNASQPGLYLVSLRMASPNSGRFVEVSADGGRPIWYRVPNTGSFETWATVTLGSTFDMAPYSAVAVTRAPMPVATGIENQLIPVQLSAGTHVLALTFHGDGQNLDWLELSPYATPTPPNGTFFTPLAVPGTIQAEDYDLGGEGVAYHDTTPGNEGGAYRHDDVDIEKQAGLSTPNVGWIRDGEWLAYTATIEPAETYALWISLASPNAGRSVVFSVDGEFRQTIMVPQTGSFERFSTAMVAVNLPAGTHTLKLTFHGDGQNVDWIRFTKGPVTTTPMTPVTTPVPSGAGFVALPTTAAHGSAVKFTVTPASGKTITSAWWSFDAPAHLNTWNSRNVNPTFFYPAKGTFSPLVKLVYTDGSTETVQRADYVTAT